MLRYVFFAVSIIAFAMHAPQLFQDYAKQNPDFSLPSSSPRPTVIAAKDLGDSDLADPKANSFKKRVGEGRSTQLFADDSNHFTANVLMNDIYVDVLVDTGATGVAISESVANRLGMSFDEEDFVGVANTANGKVRFAPTKLDVIEIGDVRVEDVEAFVLPNHALQGKALLGMSFLNKLSRFEFSGDRLVLVE